MNSIEKREKPRQYFIKYHFPMILYAIAIISLSSISYLNIPEIRFLAFDKVAHFFEYAIFAFLAIRSFLHISEKITQKSAFLMTSLFILLFAIFDEYFVQNFSRRHSSIYDVIADVVGAILILLIYWIHLKRTADRRKTEGA